MATLNQIDANRLNSRLPSGPATPETDDPPSRRNPLKTGIAAQSHVIPGEDPIALDTLAAEYYEQFQPATPLERFLVDALVSADWLLRRLRRVEAELWANQISSKKSFCSLNKDAPLGQIFEYSRDAFTRLQRRIDSAERSYYRALTQLRRSAPVPPAVPPVTELPPRTLSPVSSTPEPDHSAPVAAPAPTSQAKLASFFPIPESGPAARAASGPRSFDSTSRSRYPAVNLRCFA